MKKEIADQWIAALRSGEYKQTTGMLKDSTNSFCCLGVLCDISKQGKWNDHAVYKDKEGNDLGIDFLTNTVKKWAGMESSDGEIDAFVNNNGDILNSEEIKAEMKAHNEECDYDDELNNIYDYAEYRGYESYANLADLNDKGISFEEIANFIEKNWEKL